MHHRAARGALTLLAGLLLLVVGCSEGTRTQGTTGPPPTAVAPLDNNQSTTGRVDMFPIPGSRTALPATQLTFRGIASSKVTGITVTGSQSGVHPGRIEADSDHRGASFIPDTAFSPGETVTVSSALPINGAVDGSVHFQVAVPGKETAPVPNSGAAGAPPPADPVTTFRTDPLIRIPQVRILANSDPAPGLVALAVKDSTTTPRQLMLVRNDGRLVWDYRLPHNLYANNFRVQTYHHKPVLTWWAGTEHRHGYGTGHDTIMNSHYRVIAKFRAGNGLNSDLHEFQLTPQGTALVTAFDMIRWDLAPYGGSSNGLVLDSVVQEIDVKTGLVLFQWNALDHVSPALSYGGAPKNGNDAWDFFHGNSIQQLPDGNLLISSRDTNALYKINYRTGAVMWTLGGRNSSFSMGPGARFYFQHDARWQGHGLISLFDDGGGPPRLEPASRAITLRLSQRTKTVSLVHSYAPTTPIASVNQGSTQLLSNGDVLAGWGDQPFVTEFNAAGKLVWELKLPHTTASYRAYRVQWVGKPLNKPRFVVRTAASRKRVVDVSWSGDTRTRRWALVQGTVAQPGDAVATAPDTGFQTTVTIPPGTRNASLEALDAAGHILTTVQVLRDGKPA